MTNDEKRDVIAFLEALTDTDFCGTPRTPTRGAGETRCAANSDGAQDVGRI